MRSAIRIRGRTRWRRRVQTVLAGAVLSAAVAAPAQAQRVERGDPARLAFWHSFGDATLERLVLDALDANRDIQVAQSRIAAARAVRTHAALDLAPTVHAAAGWNLQRLASAVVPGAPGRLPEQELWDAGLQMSWELDVFGRNRRALQAQGALLSATESDARDVELAIAGAVAHTYFELRGVMDRHAVALQNAENQRRTLELTQLRLDAGRGTALDTERAQAQLSSTLAEIPLLEAGASAARHRLAVLLGRQPDELSIEAAGVAALPALYLHDVSDVVRRRPDVRSAADRTVAGSAFVGAAKAGYLPRLSIAGSAGYTATAFDALGSSGPARYAVGPVLSWPLLDLGRVKTDVDAARALENEAKAQHEQIVLRAHEEVQTAHSAYEAARARLQHLEDAAAASERATHIARLRYQEGTTDFLEVLDAERRQLEAQDRLATGRTDAALRLVVVYRATGGLLRPAS
jgi:outer membrane protein, multidrug efflux system